MMAFLAGIIVTTYVAVVVYTIIEMKRLKAW